MPKQSYREAQRIKPIGKEGIEKCRDIVKNGYSKINEVAVDSYSASGILAVYDALNEKNQEKFRSLTVHKAATIAFKLINNQRA